MGNDLGLIELIGSFAIVLGFCAYQLWATKRSMRKDRESAEDARHPEGEHELRDR